MAMDQFSAQCELPAEQRRHRRAEEWLSGVLREWSLTPALAGRWLNGAHEQLGVEGPVDLFVQYDAVMSLFTLEIWREGQRVYGIDDWLG